MQQEFALIWAPLGVSPSAASPKTSPDDSQDSPPDSVVTGSWTYSQVTVHVHGQEVLSEETAAAGAEPESPGELQDPVQASPPEEAQEETPPSPNLGEPQEQSPGRESQLQPLQESGGKPQQDGGFVAECGEGYFCSAREVGLIIMGINHGIWGVGRRQSELESPGQA